MGLHHDEILLSPMLLGRINSRLFGGEPGWFICPRLESLSNRLWDQAEDWTTA